MRGRRVVVTGMGIVSCLGNDLDVVSAALRAGRSGLRHSGELAELGLDAHVIATPSLDIEQLIERKTRRFMAQSAAFGYIALRDAIADAGLSETLLRSGQCGLITGSGIGSSASQHESTETLQTRGFRRVSPYLVPRWMGSTVSANLATAFGIRGLSYSTTSACASSAHAIGNAWQQIACGLQDVMLTGGADENHWTITTMFDAMGALSTHYNDAPQRASRPFDAQRDGFVIASGAGMLVLESLEHAEARGARIYAEMLGYAACSDGADMVQPSGEGAQRCMRMALQHCSQPVDYINAHATGTTVGDIVELRAIEAVFGQQQPLISSTKALTGHSMGAAAAHEAIYSLLMMRDGFVAASHNIDEIDPAAATFNIVRSVAQSRKLDTVISNSFGFGGTNATLVFGRYHP